MTVNITSDEAFTAGEIPEPLAYTFRDGNGDALTGVIGTVVAKFQWHRRGDTGPATVADATFDQLTGVCTYEWTGAELAVAGIYDAEMWIGNGTNRYDTVRIVYYARQPVAEAPDI